MANNIYTFRNKRGGAYEQKRPTQVRHSTDLLLRNNRPHVYLSASNNPLRLVGLNDGLVEWREKLYSKPTIYSSDIHLQLHENYSLSIPTELEILCPAILKSKYILELQDNWDGENSVKYDIKNWQAAIDFVQNFSTWILKKFSKHFYIPKIHHGPNGTIDLLWEEKDFNLFVNIDKIENKGSFYSFDGDSQFSEGEFKLDSVNFRKLPLPIKL